MNKYTDANSGRPAVVRKPYFIMQKSIAEKISELMKKNKQVMTSANGSTGVVKITTFAVG
jgi:hypothetical protein